MRRRGVRRPSRPGFRSGLLPLARLAVLGAVAFLLAGCAASGPPRPSYLDDPSLHPRFGGPRYLKAVGMSRTSQAQAETVARADVAAQVVSTLRAATTDRMESVRKGADEQALAEYRRVITTETSFDRAELIHVDPASGFHDEQGGYWALAYLDRVALRKALEPAYRQDEASFAALADQANLAYEQGDPRGFGRAYRAAAARFAEMAKQARLLFVACGGPYPPHQENLARFLALIGRKVEIRQALRFCILMDGPASRLGRQRLATLFQGFFERAGLRAEISKDCLCSGPFVYTFRVHARERFNQGMLGPVCRLFLSAEVANCKTGRKVLELNLCSGRPVGAHTSSKDKALGRMYASLDDEALYRTFSEKMHPRFTVE